MKNVILQVKRLLFVTVAMAAIVGIAACAGALESDQPAERIYWMEPLDLQGDARAGDSLPSITITVDAAPGLDTDRILTLESGSRLNQYAAARWPDNAPEVLESLILRTLESSGDYSRITNGTGGRATEWQLELELREFYTQASASDGGTSAKLSLSGYITCHGADHRITAHASASLADERLSLIVAAFQIALHDVSRSLVSQVAKSCQSPD